MQPSTRRQVPQLHQRGGQKRREEIGEGRKGRTMQPWPNRKMLELRTTRPERQVRNCQNVMPTWPKRQMRSLFRQIIHLRCRTRLLRQLALRTQIKMQGRPSSRSQMQQLPPAPKNEILDRPHLQKSLTLPQSHVQQMRTAQCRHQKTGISTR